MCIQIDETILTGQISCVISPARGEINITANVKSGLGPYFESLVDGEEHRVEVYDDFNQLYLAAYAVFTDTNAFILGGIPAEQSNLNLTGTATGGLPDGKYYVSS